MKSSRFIPMAIALVVLLALSASLSAAQGTVPQGGAQPQATLGSAFTYQGQLLQDGTPVNGTRSMAFSLYDAASGGNLVGGPLNKSVDVTDGVFTVLLDFGSGVLTGDTRWLKIAVEGTTLSPRQALTATPYALSLRPGADIVGAVSDDAILYAYNHNTGPSMYSYGLMGRVASTEGVGVYGHANALSGATYGVFGRADSPAGTGISGHATAATGATYGVFGQTDSTAGTGVRGHATANSGTTYGVYGQTDSPSGRGVAGYAGAASGDALGVYGRTESTDGSGVWGYAAADSGYTNGVVGTSDSPHGNGVAGYANAASGQAWGVYGQTNSTEGSAVRGYAIAASGATYGVYGQVNSSAGIAVYGTNTRTSSGIAIYGKGPNAILGDSSTPNYGAVVGRNLATTGTGMGVYGSSASTAGQGVYGYASASSGVPVGIVGETESSDGFGVYSWGDFAASGTKSAVVQTQGYGYRRLYSMESPEVLFEDVGTARLVDGQAVVAIDPIFAQAVNLEQPYQVFLTAQGEAPVLLWVTEKTAASFTVRGVTLDGQAADSSFDYRLIARRLGYEDVRLEPVQLPARVRNEPNPAAPQEQPWARPAASAAP